MKDSTLHTCPDCGQGNFTATGLKAHQGGKTCKARAAAKPADVATLIKGYEATAETEYGLAKTADADAIKGQQLTDQYHRATGGMKEVIIFGAMMMQLREEYPEMTKKGNPKLQMSKRGQLESEGAPLTLAKWLETYAPQVKRTTALRFLHVTESISEQYTEIVGAKVAKAISLPDLVTRPATELPQGFEAKQLELFDFINGTSQRSWLDRFSPESPQKKGHTTKVNQGNDKPRTKTAAEITQEAEEEIISALNLLDGWFLAGHHTRVSKDTRTTVDAVLTEAIKKIRGVKE